MRPRSVARRAAASRTPPRRGLRGRGPGPGPPRPREQLQQGDGGHLPPRAALRSGGAAPGGAPLFAAGGRAEPEPPFSPGLHSPQPPGALTVEGRPAQGGTAPDATRARGCFSRFGSGAKPLSSQDAARWGHSRVPAAFCGAGRCRSASSRQGPPRPPPPARSLNPAFAAPTSAKGRSGWGRGAPLGQARGTGAGPAEGRRKGRGRVGLPRGADAGCSATPA